MLTSPGRAPERVRAGAGWWGGGERMRVKESGNACERMVGREREWLGGGERENGCGGERERENGWAAERENGWAAERERERERMVGGPAGAISSRPATAAV